MVDVQIYCYTKSVYYLTLFTIILLSYLKILILKFYVLILHMY